MLVRIIFFMVGLSVAIAGNCLLAHELADGFVERAVQIVIRDQTASMTYSFGANEKTMSALITDRLEIQIANRIPDDSKGNDLVLDEAVAKTTDDDNDGENRVQETLLKSLAEGLVVKIDGVRKHVQTLTINPSPRHHFTFVASLQFELPESESLKLSIIDENFQKLDGAARYAIKAAGSTMILKSNAAPIIVRAQRHELDAGKPEQRQKACRIDATIASSKAFTKDK